MEGRIGIRHSAATLNDDGEKLRMWKRGALLMSCQRVIAAPQEITLFPVVPAGRFTNFAKRTQKKVPAMHGGA